MPEELLAEPALPAKSAIPVLSSVMTLEAAVVLDAGVSVAVHVMPPSPELRLLSEALGALRSAKVKPVTASEKVIVTKLVTPIRRALVATTMLAVGRTPSTNRDEVAPTLFKVVVALVDDPSRIVPPLRSMLAPIAMPSLSAAPMEMVLLKTSALMPLPETYEAYTVDAPIVRASRGVPVTFTLAEKLTVKSRFCPIVYVPVAGTLTLVTTGALIIVATCTALPLLIALDVTTAVKLPADGLLVKVTVS